ncbi:MAG: hypothetical protein HY905_23390 [Deltaproteobacteria bacterium]|nr:hypothetical protein [Deltaproteobacteria bacterium]
MTPFVERDLDSFVHRWLVGAGQASDFTDNQPRNVRLVHPFVTLFEKLDAISRRLAGNAPEPASFVRHYEDAARIIERQSALPPAASTASLDAPVAVSDPDKHEHASHVADRAERVSRRTEDVLDLLLGRAPGGSGVGLRHVKEAWRRSARRRESARSVRACPASTPI